MESFDEVHHLLFDAFGTILDLGGSLDAPLAQFLEDRKCSVSSEQLWSRWRYRQRIEQYQDNLLMMGHSGYTEVARRALVYVLRQSCIAFSQADVAGLMSAWRQLSPFDDVVPGLKRLSRRFKLVILSNGEPEFLDHLVRQRIRFEFHAVFSVQQVGAFKPHPGVYRMAANRLGAEPGQLMLVSANTFDVMGARSCGYRGAWVDRYGLPYEETPYQADVHVQDFGELAERLAA